LKTASPLVRLQQRSLLLGLASSLKSTQIKAERLAAPHLDFSWLSGRAFDYVLGLARDLKGELDGDFGLANALANALADDPADALDDALVRAVERASDFARDLVRGLDLVRVLDLVSQLVNDLKRSPFHLVTPNQLRDLDRALSLVRSASTHALDSDFGLVLALARDLELLAHDLDGERDLDFRAYDLGHAVDRVWGLVSDRIRNRVRALTSEDFGEASNNLIVAASNFVGADLTNVDLARVDLERIRWGNETQWPTREWADRIRGASVEQPPGSGIFVVLPEGSQDSAAATLV